MATPCWGLRTQPLPVPWVAIWASLHPCNPVPRPAKRMATHFWSFHVTGANFLLCDGSVHFLSYSASSVFPQLCTRAGGEIFTLPY